MWDVFLAGQISKARRQARDFLALTAVCGLFVVPAALIEVAASMSLTARAIYPVAWAWPVILICFVLQSGYALRRRLVSRLLAFPIFALNVVLFLAASVRYLDRFVPELPSFLIGIDAAQTGALGFIFGRPALWSPLLLQLPLLAPAYPARWKISKTFRALIALAGAAAALLIVLEYPRAVRAARTFRMFDAERLRERPNGDFAVGLRVFPALREAPPPLALANDLALADTLDVAILSVVLRPAGTTALALDSLDASLADLRRDSVQLAISLGYDPGDGAAYGASPTAYTERRLAMIDRVVRRVRPDVLLPALDPYEAGRLALGAVPVSYWQGYLERAGALAHRLRPRTRIGVAASAFTPEDSTLYAWATRSRAVDLVGFSLAPSYGGGAALAARMRIAERWMRTNREEQWIFAARSFPRLFGEANQARAVWGTLAWATTQPRVRALVIDGAADYEALVGLRAPGGRLRPAVASVDRARRALEEAQKD